MRFAAGKANSNEFRYTNGTTPARGEEARVVVYQPRGVGLIHTQPRPSDAHYTQGILQLRK